MSEQTRKKAVKGKENNISCTRAETRAKGNRTKNQGKTFSSIRTSDGKKVTGRILTCLFRLMVHISFPQQASPRYIQKRRSRRKFHIKKFYFCSKGKQRHTEARKEWRKKWICSNFFNGIFSQKDPQHKRLFSRHSSLNTFSLLHEALLEWGFVKI